MPTVPDKYPDDNGHNVLLGSDSNFGFLVRSNGDLYVAGGKYLPNHDDWVHRNNFFKYNVQQNIWTTLPPMQHVQNKPELFESGEYIYTIGKVLKHDEGPFNIQRYCIISKNWETVVSPHKLGTEVCKSAFVNDCILVLKRTDDISDIYSEEIYKFGVYNTAKDDWTEVSWIKTANVTDECGLDLCSYGGTCYLIRYQMDEEKDGTRVISPHTYRVVCDFDREMPTVTEVEEVDFEEKFNKVITEIESLDPRIQFTFDRRKLGLSKVPLRICPCH